MTIRASKLKPWMMWALMLLLMALMVHGVIETAVQLFFAKRSGVWHYLSDFREKAQKDGLSLEGYAKKLGLDPYLGWGRKAARVYEPTSNPGKPFTLLFVGDSVTAGHEVKAGEEDYPARLAATLGERGVKVVNLAVHGYGVDQMWLKLMTMAGNHHPDVIVFAYIAHDLIRPGKDFNFGLPKPEFGLSGTRLGLNLAENVADYIEDYDAARSSFRLSWWYVSRYLHNIKYDVPYLFTDYYEKIYRHIGDGLARLSQDSGIPVVVVKLTNQRRFSGDDKLIKLASSALVNPTGREKADVRYYDIDGCIPAKAKTQGVDPEKEFSYHPGPVGHRLLAECLGAYLDPLLNEKLGAK